MKKNVLLGFLISLSVTCYSQIPDLALRTLNGELKSSDFEDQKTYMVNIDTLKWDKELLSGDIVFYDKKIDMIKKIRNSIKFLKGKEVNYFADLQDNMTYYPRKQHWYMLIDEYRIDWWFSVNDPTKLETITLVK